MSAALASPDLGVEALYSKEDRLGFMLLEVEPRYASVTSALRAMLSGALQGVLLLEQRRKAEGKLIHSQHELEATVARLKYTNDELEGFAYSISPDLRAPLRAISGDASIIANDHRAELSEDAHKLFGNIAHNAKRMGLLIDDLLTFSRAGRHTLQRKVVDMHVIVRDILTVEWDDQWRGGVAIGTTDAPELAMDKHQKVQGSDFIYVSEGTIQIRVTADPNVTELWFVEHLDALSGSADQVIGGMKDNYDALVALAHDQAIPLCP